MGIVLPAADRAAIDRLHHLVVARRRDGALLRVLGVTEDGVVPGQPEKFEDAPRLALRIGDQILVADGADGERQDLAAILTAGFRITSNSTIAAFGFIACMKPLSTTSHGWRSASRMRARGKSR